MINIPSSINFYFCNNNHGLHFAVKGSVMTTTPWEQMGIKLNCMQYCCIFVNLALLFDTS